MHKKKYSSLAEFVIKTREKLNLTQNELSNLSSLSVDEIQSIEQGIDLFLATTTRQKLAKGLKVDNKEIKQYEIKVDYNQTEKLIKDQIKEKILLNRNNPNFTVNCPVCNEKLITRIAKLYDLEDNLVLHPKARCSKCPFQLND